jgi:hypothetical protein
MCREGAAGINDVGYRVGKSDVYCYLYRSGQCNDVRANPSALQIDRGQAGQSGGYAAARQAVNGEAGFKRRRIAKCRTPEAQRQELDKPLACIDDKVSAGDSSIHEPRSDGSGDVSGSHVDKLHDVDRIDVM